MHFVWWQVTESDLEPYLAQVKDNALRHSLEYGMGFLHETMPAAEKEVVNRLFSTGAIQVCCHSPFLYLQHTLSWCQKPVTFDASTGHRIVAGY